MGVESGVSIPEDPCNGTLGGFVVQMGPLTFREFTQAGAVDKDVNLGEEIVTAVFIPAPHQQTLNCSFQLK